MDGVGILSGHPLFSKAQNACNGKGHDKIQYAGDKENREVLETNTCDGLTGEEEFRNGDEVQYGRIFDIDDKFVACSRQNIPNGLG